MIEDFQNLNLFPLSIYDALLNLVVSLICGLIISFVYRFTYRGPSYSTTFANSLVLLPMITTVVIIVIGNNLARAFGLVGAMSIIRFRTAVRDTQDIIFIFFTLAIGLAAGGGLTVIAFGATLIICFVIILLVSLNVGQIKHREYLLQITYHSSEELEIQLTTILKDYCRTLKLVNLKNIPYNDNIDAYYHVKLRDESTRIELIKKLNGLNGVNDLNFFFDEGENTMPVG